MYDILTLNQKTIEELRTIAETFTKLKKVNSLEKDELIYRILDEQAISSINAKPKKTIANATTTPAKGERKRRERVNKPAKNALQPKNNAAPQPATTPVTVEATGKHEVTKQPKKAGARPVGRPRKNPVVPAPVQPVKTPETPVAAKELPVIPAAAQPVAKPQATEGKAGKPHIRKDNGNGNSNGNGNGNAGNSQ